MTENMSLAIFDPIRVTLSELKTKDGALIFDHATPEGEKDLRSWVKRVRGYKGDVARAHKDTKAEALAFGRQVDAIKNELTAGADKIITERMKPLDEIEAKKRAEAEAILEAERLEKEKAELERLADLERREAEAVRKEAEIKAREDAANAERLKTERLERENRIAAEAAESARKEAEAKAERDKAEAVEAEKEKACQAERDRLAKVEAENLERERLAEEERKRVENKKHRKSIEDDIYTALLRFVDVGPCASAVVAHMKSGEIPHVTINY